MVLNVSKKIDFILDGKQYAKMAVINPLHDIPAILTPLIL
jgi:hypothetical protein